MYDNARDDGRARDGISWDMQGAVASMALAMYIYRRDEERIPTRNPKRSGDEPIERLNGGEFSSNHPILAGSVCTEAETRDFFPGWNRLIGRVCSV